MLRTLPRFRPGVSGRLVGDEATLVSFQSGKYYTARNTTAIVAEALSRGKLDVDASTEFLKALDLNREPSFLLAVEALRKEDLVENYGTEEEPVALRHDLPIVWGFTELEVNTELADILTLDPIHDVGADGWPERAR